MEVRVSESLSLPIRAHIEVGVAHVVHHDADFEVWHTVEQKQADFAGAL